MDEKLKLYSRNENSLLDSVRGTIFKAYEKSDNIAKMKKMEIENYQKKIKDMEETLKLKEKEIDEMKLFYEKKLNEMNDENKLKSRYHISKI
jgi:hypothetical protein